MGRACTILHITPNAYHTAPAHLLFPSLPDPVVGEMLSAARFAAVGMVGRPSTHVCPGCLSVRERMASPRSGNSTGILPQLLL